jgi:hypothetical protein
MQSIARGGAEHAEFKALVSRKGAKAQSTTGKFYPQNAPKNAEKKFWRWFVRTGRLFGIGVVARYDGRMTAPIRVSIDFTADEALVLWDFLFRCSDQGEYAFADPSEERMLWELEKRLQPQLTKVIVDNPNYAQDLDSARKAVQTAFPD